VNREKAGAYYELFFLSFFLSFLRKKNRKEKLSDNFPTLVLLAVAKLTKHPIRDQIIKRLKYNYSAF